MKLRTGRRMHSLWRRMLTGKKASWRIIAIHHNHPSPRLFSIVEQKPEDGGGVAKSKKRIF